jgi:hypothetical protein
MRMFCVALAGASIVLTGGAAHAAPDDYRDLHVDGELWLRTITVPLDESSEESRDATYKVYTHVFDFEGEAPITKGHGGKYSHHRGLFIGWKDTLVHGEDYDTWHMSNSFQKHVDWLEAAEGEQSRQVSEVHWCRPDGAPFIKEIRTIEARKGEGGLRILDFQSVLESLDGAIQLRGDSHHAGMQVRLANEVSEHEETTLYVIPDGAEEIENDEVVGAWWTACSAVVRGQRYWLVHMTPPAHPTGVPVYSIRRYARFGAFFEMDLEEAKPVSLNFRIVVTKTELDRAACQALYEAYVNEAL